MEAGSEGYRADRRLFFAGPSGELPHYFVFFWLAPNRETDGNMLHSWDINLLNVVMYNATVNQVVVGPDKNTLQTRNFQRDRRPF